MTTTNEVSSAATSDDGADASTKRRRLRRTINGEPYLLTLTLRGWRVSPLGGPKTDRFHRNYLVTLNKEGAPVGCSCPSFLYGGKGTCKHIRGVNDVLTGDRTEDTAPGLEVYAFADVTPYCGGCGEPLPPAGGCCPTETTRVAETAGPVVHRLHRKDGWQYAFHVEKGTGPDGEDEVVVRRSFRGEPVGESRMGVGVGRDHFRALLREDFVRQGDL